ncbi:hypothetical protein [Desulfonatronum thiosulfatophilum]|uniref:hypothetical protein n=1 Tax=Desulfonatronum thiosulfatophilum TaxID=617002 RepID=UPI000B80AA73|nr:hypothetical protein [Desulfonatronum thiosulfatophilum]
MFLQSLSKNIFSPALQAILLADKLHGGCRKQSVGNSDRFTNRSNLQLLQKLQQLPWLGKSYRKKTAGRKAVTDETSGLPSRRKRYADWLANVKGCIVAARNRAALEGRCGRQSAAQLPWFHR